MGCILVAGSGNNGNYVSSSELPYFYPANYSKFITVGSISKDLIKSQFSNYMPVTKVNIMAPGDDILVGGRVSNNEYFHASGTSLSAPLISGILGLIKSQNPTASSEDIRNILYQSCNSIDYKNFEYNALNGYGVPNAYAAVLNTNLKRTDFYTKTLEQNQLKDTFIEFHCVAFNNGKYFWDWGDGTTSVVNTQTVLKKYSNNG